MDSSGHLPHELVEDELNGARQSQSWRVKEYEKVVAFLKAQHLYALKAQEADALTTADESGWLLLHHALNDKAASLGTIESIVKGNLNALHVHDTQGVVSFHLACKNNSLDVIQFVLSLDSSLANKVDNDGCNPLHHACKGGNLEAVTFLLEQHAALAGAENKKKLLPVHLLTDKSGKDDVVDSKVYVEVIWSLLLTYPETVVPAIIALD